jgi:hypothetical protein
MMRRLSSVETSELVMGIEITSEQMEKYRDVGANIGFDTSVNESKKHDQLWSFLDGQARELFPRLFQAPNSKRVSAIIGGIADYELLEIEAAAVIRERNANDRATALNNRRVSGQLVKTLHADVTRAQGDESDTPSGWTATPESGSDAEDASLDLGSDELGSSTHQPKHTAEVASNTQKTSAKKAPGGLQRTRAPVSSSEIHSEEPSKKRNKQVQKSVTMQGIGKADKMVPDLKNGPAQREKRTPSKPPANPSAIKMMRKRRRKRGRKKSQTRRPKRQNLLEKTANSRRSCTPSTVRSRGWAS